MKIGNTSFNVEAIKAMTLEQFSAAHPNLKDKKKIYTAITGKSSKSDPEKVV